uniref:Omp-1-18 n=1 Tax=Ehrlichia ewingii TaxID=947 RepID=B1N6C1_9RICK|nr:Omp-1-18 [Ehrlichia ewingii]
MKYKIVKTTITGLGLLLPFYASMSFGMSNTLANQVSPISFGVLYKLSHPFFNNFSIEETQILHDVATERVVGLKHDLLESADKLVDNLYNFDLSEDYVPKYDNSLFGLSFFIGYSFQNFRIELESFYEKFDVQDTKSHIVDDNYRYFALYRHGPAKHINYVTLKNDGIELNSVMLNICYDFTLNNTYITPFSCVGIGGDIISIFNTVKVKIAAQAKVGVNYLISERISLFVDGYYHGVIDNEYSNIPVQYPRNLFYAPKVTSALANLDIGYFGAEIGMKVFI